MFVTVGPTPEPINLDPALAAALTRNLLTKGCPDYLRDAATPWLAARTSAEETP